jgi:hypothetical protein
MLAVQHIGLTLRGKTGGTQGQQAAGSILGPCAARTRRGGPSGWGWHKHLLHEQAAVAHHAPGRVAYRLIIAGAQHAHIVTTLGQCSAEVVGAPAATPAPRREHVGQQPYT